MNSTEHKTAKQQLRERIADECGPINMEERFRDMLDECYSFDSVGGPFACMSPSRVLEECDPVAFRCCVNDYADSQRDDAVEVEGEWYNRDEAEKVKQELADETRQDGESRADERADEIEALDVGML